MTYKELETALTLLGFNVSSTDEQFDLHGLVSMEYEDIYVCIYHVGTRLSLHTPGGMYLEFIEEESGTTELLKEVVDLLEQQ